MRQERRARRGGSSEQRNCPTRRRRRVADELAHPERVEIEPPLQPRHARGVVRSSGVSVAALLLNISYAARSSSVTTLDAGVSDAGGVVGRPSHRAVNASGPRLKRTTTPSPSAYRARIIASTSSTMPSRLITACGTNVPAGRFARCATRSHAANASQRKICSPFPQSTHAVATSPFSWPSASVGRAHPELHGFRSRARTARPSTPKAHLAGRAGRSGEALDLEAAHVISSRAIFCKQLFCLKMVYYGTSYLRRAAALFLLPSTLQPRFEALLHLTLELTSRAHRRVRESPQAPTQAALAERLRRAAEPLAGARARPGVGVGVAATRARLRPEYLLGGDVAQAQNHV